MTALIVLTAAVAPLPASAQTVTGDEARDVLVAVLEHYMDERESRSFDDAILAGASVDPGITLDAPPDFDLLHAVARETGMTVDTVPQERWCDTSGRRPVWRVDDPTPRVDVSLGWIRDDSASVSRRARSGTSRAGIGGMTIAVHRGPDGNWTVAGRESGWHAQLQPCRPPPQTARAPTGAPP